MLKVVEDVRRVATAKGRADVGAFVVEGQRMLERALRAGWRPRELLYGDQLAQRDAGVSAVIAAAASLGTRCHRMRDSELLELSERRNSGLVTALFDLPALPALPQLLEGSPGPAIFLVLVDVDEPGNVGALMRTALASGAAAAVCVGSSDPFHPKAVRTSLGSVFKLPFARVPESAGLLDTFKARGVHTLAAVARDGGSLDRVPWPDGSVAVLVGNEGRGLADSLRDGADARVSIDLSTAADSFCVNAAAAVCLYEVQRRQRLSNLTSLEDLTRQGA